MMEEKPEYAENVEEQTSQCTEFLRKKDLPAALKACLALAPTHSKNPELHKRSRENVFSVFKAMHESDVSGVVESLSPSDCDLCLKYVYKGLEEAIVCSVLLKLHAKLVDEGGIGSVIRALGKGKKV
eukprot:TRINITY_DN81647_c0_g1_i1.p1 TRINITY_DN81647_c0_g1~~TRINITY_DN81647_c0_g1_i1.p1  ORF type:complete len:127 (+),score=41.65 TRINITY_DN81647_c0_g1_i1:162-542(+)